jgi:hypothetical protein
MTESSIIRVLGFHVTFRAWHRGIRCISAGNPRNVFEHHSLKRENSSARNSAYGVLMSIPYPVYLQTITTIIHGL